MIRIVLDASVALSWILPDDSAEQRAYAVTVLRHVQREQPLVAVPSVFPIETAAVLFRACRLGFISQQSLERGLSLLEQLGLQIHPQPHDLVGLRKLGRYYNLPPHDALYVALARELGAPLAAFNPDIRAACRTFAVDLVGV